MSLPRSTANAASYIEHVARLEKRLSTDDALRRAVGGEFVATGKLEYHLLRSRGLRDDHFVIDVGCGSGRLACQLAPFTGIRYLGCDVVPRLLAYASDLCARPDWRFETTDGATIPSADGEADFVCFFSVFTHLPQETIYRYFREAYRVLKPGGLMVMSFLEFRVPAHWAVFMASVNGAREDEHLNQFVERDSIHAWAASAGFDVRTVHAGNSEYIPLPEEIRFEDGSCITGAGSLGQSVAVLQKRQNAALAAEAAPSDEMPPSTAEKPARPGPLDAPLLNASARVSVGPGGSVALGFIIGGSSPRVVLVRAIGPTLSVFGVPNPLGSLALAVAQGETCCGENRGGWNGEAAMVEAAARVGAFSLRPESGDAALLLTLRPGAYSAVIKSTLPEEEGEALIEVYLVE